MNKKKNDLFLCFDTNNNKVRCKKGHVHFLYVEHICYVYLYSKSASCKTSSRRTDPFYYHTIPDLIRNMPRELIILYYYIYGKTKLKLA